MVNGEIRVGDLNEALRIAYDFEEVCEVYFNEDEFYLPVVHASGVASAKIRLEKEAFRSYESDGLVLGVSLEKIQKIISTHPSDSVLSFEYDDEDRRLQFEVDGQEYQIALVDRDSINHSIPRPDINYSANITIESRDFDRSVTAADMFSEEITLKYDAEKETFLMFAEGDADITKQDLTSDELIDHIGSDAEVCFDIDFITKLNQAIPEKVCLEIGLRTDRPALFKYDVIDGNGQVRYQLAPTINNS